MKEQPKWQHDCPDDVFFGTVNGIDHYLHSSGNDAGGSALIARTGNRPGEYCSGKLSEVSVWAFYGTHEALLDALRLAVRRGYLSVDIKVVETIRFP